MGTMPNSKCEVDYHRSLETTVSADFRPSSVTHKEVVSIPPHSQILDIYVAIAGSFDAGNTLALATSIDGTDIKDNISGTQVGIQKITLPNTFLEVGAAAKKVYVNSKSKSDSAFATVIVSFLTRQGLEKK